MNNILIIDCDVAINLFDRLQKHNPTHFRLALQHLSTKCIYVWIPQKVKIELTRKPHNRKKNSLLKKVLDNFQFIQECPIPVSQKEINIDNDFGSSNEGETDAILQAAKLTGLTDPRFVFSGVYLFFRDKGAISRANKKKLPVYKYLDFVDELKEVGVILPY